MQTVGILAPFVVLGIAILFVAFSGGPGKARETYLTRGGALVRVVIPILYVTLGIVVPAAIIISQTDALGGSDATERKELSGRTEKGKMLFRDTCASCHNLDAVNARGVTGPDLDEIGPITRERALSALIYGGTGKNRMPAGLLDCPTQPPPAPPPRIDPKKPPCGEDGQALAEFLSEAAGKD